MTVNLLFIRPGCRILEGSQMMHRLMFQRHNRLFARNVVTIAVELTLQTRNKNRTTRKPFFVQLVFFERREFDWLRPYDDRTVRYVMVSRWYRTISCIFFRKPFPWLPKQYGKTCGASHWWPWSSSWLRGTFFTKPNSCEWDKSPWSPRMASIRTKQADLR